MPPLGQFNSPRAATTTPSPGGSEESHRAESGSPLFRVCTSLLPGAAAGLTALTGLVYVSLAGLYGRFYQALRVRPEDVGLDRLTILTRTFGIFIYAAVLITLGLLSIEILKVIPKPVRQQQRIKSGVQATKNRLASETSPGRMVALCVGIVLLLVVVGWHYVDAGARDSLKGRRVSPINLAGAPAIDISATPARIAWLDKDIKEEPILGDPWLLYVGRNEKIAVFVACGRTVIVPENKVQIITENADSRTEETQRKGFCDSVSPSASLG